MKTVEVIDFINDASDENSCILFGVIIGKMTRRFGNKRVVEMFSHIAKLAGGAKRGRPTKVGTS